MSLRSVRRLGRVSGEIIPAPCGPAPAAKSQPGPRGRKAEQQMILALRLVLRDRIWTNIVAADRPGTLKAGFPANVAKICSGGTYLRPNPSLRRPCRSKMPNGSHIDAPTGGPPPIHTMRGASRCRQRARARCDHPQRARDPPRARAAPHIGGRRGGGQAGPRCMSRRTRRRFGGTRAEPEALSHDPTRGVSDARPQSPRSPSTA